MKRTLPIIIAVAASLTAVSCSQKPQAGPAVLTGEITGGCNQLVVLTYGVGEMTDYQYPVLRDGKFELVLENVECFIDVAIAVDNDVFGARINANDTLGILVTPAGGGRFDVAYSGDAEKESRIWTDLYDTYEYWGQYNLRPDSDPSISPDESMRMVDVKDSLFRAKYGPSLDKYYLKRADMVKGFQHAVLPEIKSMQNGEDFLEFPEYAATFSFLPSSEKFFISTYGLHGAALASSRYRFLMHL